MTLIKKQHKDVGASGSSEKNEQKRASEETQKAAFPDDNDATSETETATVNGTDDEKVETSGTKSKEESKKQPSDTDILKFYVKQLQDSSNKQKEENDSLKAQVEKLGSQITQCAEKFDGLVAEYENYRRRTTAEKENLSTESASKAVLTLLPALDNLERAMPFAESNYDSFKKGVEMTLRQLTDAFKSLGIEEIEAQGSVFDPELHDAVMHVEDDSLGESIITDVFQKGYRLGDKVVRPSVVKVVN